MCKSFYLIFVKLGESEKVHNHSYLDVIFADRVPHEHGVEGGDLVDPHPRHPNDLRHMVHGGDWQPASVLPLSEVKERDNLL